MDVINLSIGEPEIEPSRDVVALALDAAAAPRACPVVAAGNDFDDFGHGSLLSPGSSARRDHRRRDHVRHLPGDGGLLVVRPDADLAPAQARRRRPGVVDPLRRARRVALRRPGRAWPRRTWPGGCAAPPAPSRVAPGAASRRRWWRPPARERGRGGRAAHARRRGSRGRRRGGRAARTASPVSVSFGLLRPDDHDAQRHARRCGRRGGAWSATGRARRRAAGTSPRRPGSARRAGDAHAHADERDGRGRGVGRRRPPPRQVTRGSRSGVASRLPGSSSRGRGALTTGRVRGEHTRPRGARRRPTATPRCPTGPVTNDLAGPEQVFRVRVTRRVANFGVVITQLGPGSRVEPRIVAAGDENRLTGYAALPLNLNPYVDEFGAPVPVAGALRPAPGTYHVVFDSPTPAGAGAFRFRFWIEGRGAAEASLARRQVRRGEQIRVLVRTPAPGSTSARSRRPWTGGRLLRVSSATRSASRRARSRSGRHRLRVELSDYQETRNNENVLRILPNTRVVSARVTVRRGSAASPAAGRRPVRSDYGVCAAMSISRDTAGGAGARTGATATTKLRPPGAAASSSPRALVALLDEASSRRLTTVVADAGLRQVHAARRVGRGRQLRVVHRLAGGRLARRLRARAGRRAAARVPALPADAAARSPPRRGPAPSRTRPRVRAASPRSSARRCRRSSDGPRPRPRRRARGRPLAGPSR